MGSDIWMIVLLPVASFIYASVGHGGASSYILILSFFNFAPDQIRPVALILNILISIIAFLSYKKVCVFPFKIFFILIISSIPAAFVGGMISIEASLYRKILGILLLFPAFRLLGFFPVAEEAVIKCKAWILMFLGASIGLVSGLIGIGGGIILSPVLLMLGWARMRETAALSAFFIFVNSIAGYLGSSAVTSGIQPGPQFLVIVTLTIIGGFLGAHLGSQRLHVKSVKGLLTMILLIASVKFIIA